MYKYMEKHKIVFQGKTGVMCTRNSGDLYARSFILTVLTFIQLTIRRQQLC